MKFLKVLIREVGSLLIAIVSIAVVYPYLWIYSIPVSILTIGALYTMLKPIYDHRNRLLKIRLKRTGMWFLNVLYQLWSIVKYSFLMVGYIIDLIGNVLLGEIIEDLVGAEEETLFGDGGVTISASLGDLKRQNKLNRFGLWLANALSALDPMHDDHCIAAIQLYEYKKSLKSKNN